VSAYPASVTADVYAATQQGVSLGAATARAAGLDVVAEYARGVRGPAGDLVESDALPAADVLALVEEGRRLGLSVAERGLVCLGEIGIGNTTVAAALSCALLGLEPDAAVGLGAAADSAMVTRKQLVVTRALARARAVTPAGWAIRGPRPRPLAAPRSPCWPASRSARPSGASRSSSTGWSRPSPRCSPCARSRLSRPC
jgi:nicotinate-nucleotide--dimethylbenzimidazole phosphoribosyltransferase